MVDLYEERLGALEFVQPGDLEEIAAPIDFLGVNFYQPAVVLIDPATLSTLPEREFRAGMYEALKCGVIGNPELFARLEQCSIKSLRKDRELIVAASNRALSLADVQLEGKRRMSTAEFLRGIKLS